MSAPARPRFLFEPGYVRVGARSVGGIKQAGGTGQAGGPGKGGGGKGGNVGKGRGQGLALASAFTAMSAARGPVVPSPPDLAAQTLISTTTLAVDGTFDVSGISGTYNDLVLVLITRSTIVGTTDTPTIRFNNDGGTNYSMQRFRAGTTTALTADSSVSVPTAGSRIEIPGATATAGLFGYLQITIPGYASTAWTKQFMWQESTAWLVGSQYAGFGSGLWNSTAAITRIQISNSSVGNLLAGSQLRIYGLL